MNNDNLRKILKTADPDNGSVCVYLPKLQGLTTRDLGEEVTVEVHAADDEPVLRDASLTLGIGEDFHVLATVETNFCRKLHNSDVGLDACLRFLQEAVVAHADAERLHIADNSGEDEAFPCFTYFIDCASERLDEGAKEAIRIGSEILDAADAAVEMAERLIANVHAG